MDLKTVGNVNAEKDLKFADLAINNTGVGNVRLSWNCEYCSCKK